MYLRYWGASKFCPIGTTAGYPHCLGDTGQTGWVNRSDQYWTGQTGSDQGCPEKLKSERPKTNIGEDHNRRKGRKLKLSFDELLAKYLRENEAKRANRSNDVKSSRLSPKPKSRNWNWQKKNLHAAASYFPLGPSMPIPQAPHPTSLDRYSSRG